MQWAQKQRGFTIVELLIVVVVIAILAAITIVSYNGIQNRAYDSSIKNDLENIAKQYEIYKVNTGSAVYPYGATLNNGIAFKISINKNAYDTSANYQLLNCTDPTTQGSNYALLALSKSGKKFYVSSESGGVREYTGPNAWLALTSCADVLAGSGGNGAGYSGSIWRDWIN
jgi:prepilin-type N-terminal cleavage/methylation domain-containing protein